MSFYQLPTGDTVSRKSRALIVQFVGKRSVLCTSMPNAGISHNLTHVFNHDAKSPKDGFCRMYAESMAEHMSMVAREIGLNPQTAAGLTTAADMVNAAICEEHFDNFTVTAIITAGVDKNGGRVGDTADWHEIECKTVQPTPGTVNIMLFVDAKLTDAALLQALTTCTEAKCAVMQELLAPSVYSNGIATGSGTDGTVIVANDESPVLLTNAGKHYKLGEVIGRTVMSALREALYKQSGLCAEEQHNALHRMSRFGIKTEDFCTQLPNMYSSDFNFIDFDFIDFINQQAQEPKLVTLTALYVHLLDELLWGMLLPDEVFSAATYILAELDFAVEASQLKDTGNTDKNIKILTNLWCKMFINRIKSAPNIL